MAENSAVPAKRRWRWLKRGLIAALALWIANVGLMKLLESRFVFRTCSAAESWHPPPMNEIVNVEYESCGSTMHGWWLPHPKAKGAVLLFHGNGGNLSHRGPLIVQLRDALERSVMIVDYPGYGKCPGEPTESGCYAIANDAYDWLRTSQHVQPEQIIIMGESLGGGVATDLASRKPCGALVLLKTFTSLPDVGGSLFPWLPTHWIMTNRFDSVSKIKSVNAPIFIAHGTADITVPYKLGEQLYNAAPEPKQFLTMKDVSHNDPLPADFFASLEHFLAEHANTN